MTCVTILSILQSRGDTWRPMLFCSNIFLSLPLSLAFCLSLSVVRHPVFLISGLSLRVGDVDVFFLQSKFLSVGHIHYPVNPSSYHFHTDTVVPSSDHCRTETVLPPSHHYCIETVSPSGDHYCIDIVVPSNDDCFAETVPPSSDYY